jgi:thioredoxin-dependent peroxiredoxin
MVLAVGSKAPDFEAKDTNGNNVTLSSLVGKKVVLYFYPKDDTPGCTIEACGFRDNYALYQDKGIIVLGVSKDIESSHQAFTAKYNLPFPLLCDPSGVMIKAYDVDGGGGFARRVTYVIDETGNIVHVDAIVKSDTHANDVLAALGY